MQANEALYSKECSGNPCWAVNSTSAATLKFSDYRKLCYKWQHAVLGALRTALASKEYVQTRNALLFLSYNTKVGLISADCLSSLLWSGISFTFEYSACSVPTSAGLHVCKTVRSHDPLGLPC